MPWIGPSFLNPRVLDSYGGRPMLAPGHEVACVFGDVFFVVSPDEEAGGSVTSSQPQ